MSAISSHSALPGRRPEPWKLFVKPLGLALGLVVAGVVLKTLAGGVKGGLFAHYVMGHGIEGEVIFVLGGALLTAAGLPRQAVAFAGGYAFGLKMGLALAMVAQILGCVADFYWARAIARDWVRGRIGKRLAKLDDRLSAQPFTASLTLRLLPIGNNVLLSLLAGLSSVSAPAFLIASAIGYVPQTLVFALLGSGVQVSHTTQIVLAVVLFVLSAGLGLLLMRRVKPMQAG
ncbi:TVP38/TMEM64 family protein [Acidisoma silvae]|uniref:TVP38/TMEM64 family membrane protein n=1 Tax=Acidisoma silvae TaxID=2802396 RepID=A0A963YMT4_9PROT|nr:VTT domain-containing protein [Acidisoma silvae]MCB8873574.1 TVP38/TMEM64 family protein [Acidisoma silvae]